MWSLKVLTGEQAGETFKLNNGENHIGRSPQASIRLGSKGISKLHANIKVNGNAISIQDMGSSNGTFINGLKTNQSIIQVGDKIGFHNIICEVQFIVSQYQSAQQTYQANNVFDGNAAQDLHQEAFGEPIADYAEDVAPDINSQHSHEAPKTLGESFSHYIENVMLPGIYKLAQLFELKMVLFCFVLAFIFITTALSTIPMLSITKDTIERESGRRALGVARSLVRVNQEILGKGFQSQLSTRFAEKEEGVEVALIIRAVDGSVLAPASESGSYKNVEFIHRARKMDEETFDKINSKIVGASVPIRTFDPKTGNYDIKAYAVVLYNMGNLSISEGRTISLFVQTLLMALVLGSILYFFMYKLVERPFIHLTKGIDGALKGDSRSLEPEFDFPVLKPLYTNINSLINESASNSGGDEGYSYVDPLEKQGEAKNLCSIMAAPTLALDSEGRFLALNSHAEEFIGEIEGNLMNQTLDSLYDESLKLSLQDLVERVNANASMIHTNNLEFGGVNMDIDAQGITGNGNLNYIIISINHTEGE